MAYENCHPHLATSQASSTSKANAELRKISDLEVQVGSVNSKKINHVDNENWLREEAAKLEGIKKTLLSELRNEEIKLRTINRYKTKFTTRDSMLLRHLEQGEHTVLAARRQNTRYGKTHTLLLRYGIFEKIVWGNATINHALDSIPEERMSAMLDPKSGIVCQFDKKTCNS